jgi:hypothetical protein
MHDNIYYQVTRQAWYVYYHTCIDWYEGNSKFIVPWDTNYKLVSRGTQQLFAGVKGDNKLAYPNSQSVSVLSYWTTQDTIIPWTNTESVAVFVVVVCGFQDITLVEK